MQYLLTKEELDKLKGTISAEDRADIAREVIEHFVQELSPVFKSTSRDGFDKDVFRISLEAMRGAVQRTREHFKTK